MDETINIQTVPDIPENTLANEPEYIIKKKFCFATIPSILAMVTAAFMAGFLTVMGIMYSREFGVDSWIYLEQGIVYAIQFVAVFLMCIFMFVKVNKPFICAPMIVAASGYVFHLVCSLLAAYNQEEFDMIFHNDGIGMYDYYTYSDYMTIRISYWIFLAFMIFSFVAAAVYVILASIEKTNGKVRKLWVIPAVVSALSPVMYIVYTVVSLVLYYIEKDISLLEMIAACPTVALLELSVYIPQTVAVILLCKWIANPFKKVLKKVPEVKEEKKEEKIPEPVVEKAAPQMPSKPVMPAPAPVVKQAPAKPVAPPPAPIRPAPVQMPVNTSVTNNQVTTMAQKNNIELIKQYKELLDMGAITQEEYEEKKKDLLSNQ